VSCKTLVVRKPIAISAADFIPDHPTLRTRREDVQNCRG
jgi:hypothetical protein